MKMTFKKVMSLGLVAAMTLSFAACGGNTSSQGTTGNNSETTAQTSADNGSASSEKFILGVQGPLTGSAASYGISVKQGCELAVSEINAAGGVTVNGVNYQLELVAADDEADPDKALNAYNTLMDQNIDALIGTVTSGACLAITSQTAADGILMLTPSGSALGCTEYDNAFRLCFTDPLQGVTMADYIVKELGYTKVAVIYNTSDEYSTGMMEAFVEQVAANGGEVVANEAFQQDDVDFKTQLTTIKGTDAEAIFLPIYYNDVANILTQANEMGIEVPFFGGDGWDGVLSVITDASILEGCVFLSPFNAYDTDEVVVSFVDAYNKAYNTTPDQFAADGYDCVYVIKAAMETAGSVEDADLIAAMTKVSVDGLTGTGISFTAEGEPEKGARFIEIVDGKYQTK